METRLDEGEPIGTRSEAASSPRPRLEIVFDPSISKSHRARMDYSFRTFCAVYGCTPVESGADLTLRYGGAASGSGQLELDVAYVPRDPSDRAPKPSLHSLPAVVPPGVTGFSFPIYHPGRAGPDWLGEAFEWISCAHEVSTGARDDVGRIPLSETLHGRDNLDLALPYAAAAFRGLAADISDSIGERFAIGGSPEGGSKFLVANVHDVDYLPLGSRSIVHRLAKNLALSIVDKDRRSFAEITRSAVRWAVHREQPFDLEAVVARESGLGIGSTWAFICRQDHDRDANYSLGSNEALRAIHAIDNAGAEIAVHGSYTSMDEPGRLAEEYALLEAVGGHRVVGGRQHWLRYWSPELFRELTAAGARYDASVGHSAAPGYRSGACFAYAPYDFERETPFPLLELPLAVMDGALHTAQSSAVGAFELAHRIMNNARAYGPGGLSVLWHDTVLSGAQLPPHIAELFWELRKPDDAWLSGSDVADAFWPAFQDCGLVPSVGLDPGP